MKRTSVFTASLASATFLHAGEPARQSVSALPTEVTGIGATRHDGWVYVCGGHAGDAHKESLDTTLCRFRRFCLAHWWLVLKCPVTAGKVLAWQPGGHNWREIAELQTKRFFHRTLPVADSQLLIIGGASRQEGHLADVEVVTMADTLAAK
ncbi:MAG TPA: hypothetical protein DCY13_08590 [Verrucomicrobiales bacterium]|nr:hypothetical protein [Verrucomicrobiales bacterium]